MYKQILMKHYPGCSILSNDFGLDGLFLVLRLSEEDLDVVILFVFTLGIS